MFYVTVCYWCETVILCYPVVIFCNDDPDRAPRVRLLIPTLQCFIDWEGSRSWRKQSVFITHPSPGVQTLLDSLRQESLKQLNSLFSGNTMGTKQAAECSPAGPVLPSSSPQAVPSMEAPSKSLLLQKLSISSCQQRCCWFWRTVFCFVRRFWATLINSQGNFSCAGRLAVMEVTGTWLTLRFC